MLQKAGIGSKNGKQLMADGMSWNLDWEPGNYKEVRQTFVVSVANNIYLWRKVVCFLLFVVMRSAELGCFRSCSWCLWKALGEEHGLGSMAFGLAVQKFLNIEWFLHWKFNWIVAENLEGTGMCLWCCWKDLDEQDSMEFIWEDLDSECGRYWLIPSPCRITRKNQQISLQTSGQRKIIRWLLLCWKVLV